MMQKQFRDITVGGETFRATWDMAAWATFEKLSGSNIADGFTVSASNALDALWSAIDAASASEDKPAPVTRRRLGSLVTSMETMKVVLEHVSALIESFMPMGKVTPPVVEIPSPSGGATSSQPATLELATASSGV